MIKRKLLEEVEEHLKQKEITLIVGPRQVGKTTLMKLLEAQLREKGERTLFLNLDIEEDRKFFRSQNDLLAKVRLEIGKSGFVFIDEIQRKEDAGVFLKGIYDMGLPYKFVVSGSGSMELKEKIRESLVGRKREFELEPVDFEEFVNYRTGYKYEDRLGDFFRIERGKALEFLKEYLNYGGYPRVVLAETHKEKAVVIEEIFSSYIDRDVKELVKAEKIDTYAELVRVLAIRSGQLLNLSKIASMLGISFPTLKNYLWYAEKTFIVRKLRPFFRNKNKELSKTPLYYFVDIGLRNYASASFGQLSLPDHFAFPFQNLVFNTLRKILKYTGATIHFWRTKDGAEIDFVIKRGEEIIPSEVKFKELKKQEITRSMLSFIRKYKPKRAFVVSLGGFEGVYMVERTEVVFGSVFDLIMNRYIFT